MRRLIYISLLLVLRASFAAAQDYSFSQYFLDKLSLSPAFVSVGDYSELGCSVRSQWPGIDGGYRIYMAEYQQKLPGISSGMGARAYGNMQGGGAYGSTGFSAVYAYEVSLADNLKLSMGIEAGYTSRGLSQQNLVYYSMIDRATGQVGPASEKVSATRYSQLYLSAGAVLYTRRTLLGLGFQRLARLDIDGGTGDAMGFSLMLNHKFVIDGNPDREKQFLVPCVTYSRTPYNNIVMPGVYYQGLRLMLSLAVRTTINKYMTAAALSAYAGYSFGRLELGVGYDFELQSVLRQAGGATEACLKYKIKNY